MENSVEERYTYMVKNVAHIIEHYKLYSDAWNRKKNCIVYQVYIGRTV